MMANDFEEKGPLASATTLLGWVLGPDPRPRALQPSLRG